MISLSQPASSPKAKESGQSRSSKATTDENYISLHAYSEISACRWLAEEGFDIILLGALLGLKHIEVSETGYIVADDTQIASVN